MQTLLAGRDLISLSDLSKQETESILDAAASMKRMRHPHLLEGKLLCSCFFEPSTRTRLSFEAAMLRLGGSVIGCSEPAATSLQKGESLSDMMRVVSAYADLIVLRHPQAGSAAIAALASHQPVINAGDGSHQHPTQTLTDLFTIRELFGRLDSLEIALAGDLLYSRAIHSLVLGLAHYSVRLHLVSSEHLALPEEQLQALKAAKIPVSFHTHYHELLPKLDVLYLTRRQIERGGSCTDESVSLTASALTHAKPSLRILHPLPRLHELDISVDATMHAAYFEQAANGLFVRSALLALLLGKAP